MHREGEESRDEFYSKYFLPRGAITESAYMTHKLNLEALKESYLHHKLNSCSTRHRVVLWQEDTENVSNPHGLLIAYEERLDCEPSSLAGLPKLTHTPSTSVAQRFGSTSPA